MSNNNQLYTVTGTKNDDVITIEDESTKVLAGNGDDLVIGSEYDDIMFGNNGEDTFIGNGGSDIVNGGNGDDTILYETDPIDFEMFQINGYTQKIVDADGNDITFQNIEFISFQFDPTLNYPDGNYTIDITGAIDNEAYVADLGLQTTQEDTAFTLDLNDLVWDYEDSSVWNNGDNNLSNQELNFEITTLSYAVEGDIRDKGVVDVDSNGVLTFTPNLNLDGLDTLSFSVSDGVNAPIVRTYDIQIQAVADTPDLSVAVSQNEEINRINFDVNTMLNDLDGSEALSLRFSDLPNNADLYMVVAGGAEQLLVDGATDQNDPNDANGILDLSNLPIQHDLQFILEIPKYADSNFDFTITARADEGSVGTDGVLPAVQIADISHTTNINYDYTTTTKAGVSHTENLSMWDDSIPPGSTVFQDSFTLPGTDILPDISGDLLDGALDFNIAANAGLTADILATSGDLDTSLNYNVTFESFYNKTTDVLDIETDYDQSVLNSSEFSTFSPNVTITLGAFLDLIYDFSAAVELEILDTTVFSETIFDENGTLNIGGDIATVDASILEFKIPEGNPYGDLTLKVPVVDTISSYSGTDGLFQAQGEDDFLELDIDIDEIISTLLPGPGLPSFSKPLPGGGEARVELIDLHGLGTANIVQDFEVSIEELLSTISFENGLAVDIAIGDSAIRQINASTLDDDNDGQIDYLASLDFNPEFSNTTSVGFNVGYTVDILKASIELEVCALGQCVGFSESATAFSEDGSTQVAEIPVFQNTFELDTQVETLSFIA